MIHARKPIDRFTVTRVEYEALLLWLATRQHTNRDEEGHPIIAGCTVSVK